MKILKNNVTLPDFLGNFSIIKALENAGIEVSNQRVLEILTDKFIEPNFLNRDISFLQTKVLANPSQIILLVCLWSVSDAATAHIILMFTKMYQGKSATPATLYTYFEENKETISLTEMIVAILQYDLLKGKMFSFATPLYDIDETKYYLAFIHGEQFGKLLVSMPITDVPVCHPDNFWVYAA